MPRRRKAKYGYDDHGKPIRSDRDDDFDDLDSDSDSDDDDDSFTWEDMQDEEFAAAADELNNDNDQDDEWDDAFEWSDLNPDTPECDDDEEDFTP